MKTHMVILFGSSNLFFFFLAERKEGGSLALPLINYFIRYLKQIYKANTYLILVWVAVYHILFFVNFLSV